MAPPPTPRKLTHGQIAGHRSTLAAAQAQLCKLCSQPLGDAGVLDHDHKSGRVRGVLHRGCNAMLGHLENNRSRYNLYGQRLFAMLGGVQPYLRASYTDAPLHPTHKPPGTRTRKRKR